MQRPRLRSLIVLAAAAVIGCGESGGPTVPPADPDRKVGEAPNTQPKSKRNKGDAVRKPRNNLTE